MAIYKGIELDDVEHIGEPEESSAGYVTFDGPKWISLYELLMSDGSTVFLNGTDDDYADFVKACIANECDRQARAIHE